MQITLPKKHFVRILAGLDILKEQIVSPETKREIDETIEYLEIEFQLSRLKLAEHLARDN